MLGVGCCVGWKGGCLTYQPAYIQCYYCRATPLRGTFKLPISELDLSIRATDCLRSENITTIGKLVKQKKDLFKLKFGRVTLKEIEKKLAECDLHLDMLCQGCHGIRLLYEKACEENGTDPEDEGLSLYIRAFRQGAMKGLHRFGQKTKQDILQLELHQATLPHMVKRILDESFIASSFSTKADWNEDRLARIEKLVEPLIF